MSDRRVTSTDVAKAAGLSRATVSYVLNNDPRQAIPEPTRQRVLDAAARLGYRPYGPARLLRGARSSVVLMLTPGLEHANDVVAASIINQLGVELAKHNLHLVWQLGIQALDSAAIDLAPAVVLSSASEDEEAFADLLQQFSVPVLPAFPGLDGFIGGAAATQVEHLASSGRKVLAFGAPESPALAASAEVRWGAMVHTCRTAGLPEPSRFIIPTDRAAASAAARAAIANRPELDAIVAYNDTVAFSLLAGLHDLGVTVPDQLAVMGVDDDPFGALTVPSLSTVRADVTQFVIDFARYISGVARGDSPDAVRLPTRSQVIARASA